MLEDRARRYTPLSVLGVSDGVADDVLQEDFEDTASLLVDEARDTLDSSSTSESADGGLGDALDVVAQDLAVTLGSSLSEALRGERGEERSAG